MAFLSEEHPLWKELESIAQDEGLLLYDVELRSQAHLVVFVSREKSAEGDDEERRQGGVTSGDCAKLCRRLIVCLGAKGDTLGVSSEPKVEVSSPGINRHLRLESHFAGALGERIRVQLHKRNGAAARSAESLKGAITGELCSAEQGRLSVIEEKSEETIEFGLNEIQKARVDFKFS